MNKHQWILLFSMAVGLLIGGLLTWNILDHQNQSAYQNIHHHANWAIFVNSQRAMMTDDKYMEPLVACQLDGSYVDPQQRVHMHENNHDLIHVHHAGVTWGHLMANLDMTFGADYFITDDGVLYYNQEESTMKYILNGKAITNPNNRIIDSEDRLLISYGPESTQQVIEQQYSQVTQDAHEHNGKDDPASCSGSSDSPSISHK